MKQKYEVLELLQKYFTGIQSDFEPPAPKKIGSKKYLYNLGDPITNIYFVLQGEVKVGYTEKEIVIPPHNIVGDYEIINRMSRRTTSFKAKSKAVILILPKEFYNRIKKEITLQYQFLTEHLLTENPKLRYAISKNFIHHYVFREDHITNQHGQNQFDVALVQSGLFTVKKFIGVGVSEKYKIQVEKQFALVQIGQGELIKSNIICDSPKGEVFICKFQYLELLRKSFQEFQLLLRGIYDKKNSLLQRQNSIKKLCIENSFLSASILPTVFHNQKMKLKTPKMKGSLKTEMTERNNRKDFSTNHYQVNRAKNNQFFSTPTDSNLSLIPLVRIRKPALPEAVKVPRQKVLLKFFKSNSEKVDQIIKYRSEEKQQTGEQIPQTFTSRFQKKMFLRPSNPFRHFREKTQSPKQSIEKQLWDVRLDSNRSSLNKKNQRKKSFLLISCDEPSK